MHYLFYYDYLCYLRDRHLFSVLVDVCCAVRWQDQCLPAPGKSRVSEGGEEVLHLVLAFAHVQYAAIRVDYNRFNPVLCLLQSLMCNVLCNVMVFCSASHLLREGELDAAPFIYLNR